MLDELAAVLRRGGGTGGGAFEDGSWSLSEAAVAEGVPKPTVK